MRRLFARSFAGLLALVALAAAAPRPAAAQRLPVLTRLNSPAITLRAGSSKLLRVQLTIDNEPAPDFQVDWQILSTTAGATGATTTVTDFQGISSARFYFPRAGVTQIRALVPQAGVVLYVDYTVTSVHPPPPPPTETHLVLQPEGATSLALVLGDRAGLSVALRTDTGAPAAGVPVRFAVLTSPGSPGVGRSDQTVASGADGVATAFFGFSTVGRVTFRASSADPGFVFEPAAVDFTVDVDSLSALVPGRKTWQSAGEALDAICRAVFVDANGVPRTQPTPLPLCTYMTVTLDTQEERAQAIASMSPTGLSSQTSTALAGVEQQKASVQSRLSALRGGGLRGAVNQLALTVDGVEIGGDALAAANADGRRYPVFSRRLDDAFARLYAGLDTGDEPARSEPAAPQVAARRERPWGLFVTGRLTRGDQSRGLEEDAFDFDTAGVTAGFDRAVTANGFLGFAVSGLRNKTDLGGNGGKLDTDAWSVTVYGIGEGEKGYVQGTATYGQSSYDQRRRLPMPALGDLTARAEFDGDQLAGDLELGRSMDGRAGSLTVFVRGSWARASIDAFAERGAVAALPGADAVPVDFGVAVEKQELDSLLGAGGLDWGKAFSIRGGLVIPQLTATWSHEFSNDAQQVRARFLGDTAAASSFFVFTDTPDRDWLTASAALRFQFLWGSFFVSYDHDLMRDDLELRTLNAGLRFEL